MSLLPELLKVVIVTIKLCMILIQGGLGNGGRGEDGGAVRDQSEQEHPAATETCVLPSVRCGEVAPGRESSLLEMRADTR